MLSTWPTRLDACSLLSKTNITIDKGMQRISQPCSVSGPLQMTLSVHYAMPQLAVLVAINTWSSGMSIKDPSNDYVGIVKRPLWRYCVVSVSHGGSKEIAVFAAK